MISTTAETNLIYIPNKYSIEINLQVITPLQQYAGSYTFSTSGSAGFSNHLTLIVRQTDTSAVLLDGQAVAGSGWTSIDSQPPMATKTVSLPQGAHDIRLSTSSNTFLATLDGYSSQSSYSYNAGSRMAPINEVNITILES